MIIPVSSYLFTVFPSLEGLPAAAQADVRGVSRHISCKRDDAYGPTHHRTPFMPNACMFCYAVEDKNRKLRACSRCKAVTYCCVAHQVRPASKLESHSIWPFCIREDIVKIQFLSSFDFITFFSFLHSICTSDI
jgi:hypothetical protein